MENAVRVESTEQNLNTPNNQDFVKSQLDRIRKRLLDLTNRNRLLNYRPKKRTIRIIRELPDSIFRLLVAEGSSMEFLHLPEDELRLPYLGDETQSQPSVNKVIAEVPLPDPTVTFESDHKQYTDKYLQTTLNEETLEAAAYEYYSQNRKILEETGTSTLYLALGFLEWFESDDSDQARLAPLILIPVALDRAKVKIGRGARIKYQLKYDEQDLESNHSLSQKMLVDFDLILPKFSEEDGQTPEDYFRAVTETIKDRKRWRVRREINLDFFSFAKILMYLDLDPTRWPAKEGPEKHLLVRSILGIEELEDEPLEGIVQEPSEIDRNYPELPLVMDADSSQEEVIRQVLAGRSLVVQGPPGTGKSQTITNLIGALLDSGKKVLFVAEKLAALEVVKSRLDRVGLGDFVFELHSHQVSKSKVLDSIRSRLERKKGARTGIDGVLKTLHESRIRLCKYVAAINAPHRNSGYVVRDLIGYQDSYVQIPKTVQLDSVAFESREKIDAIRNSCRLLVREAAIAAPETNPWKLFRFSDSAVYRHSHIIDWSTQLTIRIETALSRLAELPDNSEHSGWTLQMSEELDRCQWEMARLTEILPKSFEQRVSAASDESLNSLEQLIKLHNEHKVVDLRSREVLMDLSDLSENQLNSGIELCERAKKDNFGGFTLANLERLGRLLNELIESFSQVQSAFTACSSNLGLRNPALLSDVPLIRDLIRRVVRQIPAGASAIISKRLLDDDLMSVLDWKETQAQVLQKALEEIPGLKTESSIEKMENTKKVFDANEGKIFRFLKSEFRAASRFVQQLKGSKVVGDQMSPLIQQALKLQSQINEFNADKRLADTFDGMFCGMETNWQQLRSIVSWIREVRDSAPSTKFIEVVSSDYGNSEQVFNGLLTQMEQFLRLVDDRIPSIISLLETGDISLFSSYESLPPQRFINLLLALSKQANDLLLGLENVSKDLQRKVSEIGDGLEACLKARSLQSLMDRERKIISSELDNYLSSQNEVLPEIVATVDWVKSIRADKINGQWKKWLLEKETPFRLRALTIATEDAIRSFSEIDVKFNEAKDFLDEESLSLLRQQDFKSLLKDINLCLRSSERLQAWTELCMRAKELSQSGASQLVNKFLSKEIDGTDLENVFLKSAFEALVQDAILDKDILRQFSRPEHEAVRDQFRKCDLEIQSLFGREIAERIDRQYVPTGQRSGKVSEWSELGLLQHEINKKRRNLPVREIVKRAGQALQAIKPCFMMSPLSVAQFIPPNGVKFDVIVMDEASQLRPEDCLGAICRGQQLVVVGDAQQLPPTSFFERSIDAAGADDDDDEETAVEDMESILDACQKRLGQNAMLRWHYRSAHEDLIRFSNYHFYGQELEIFPSKQPEHPDLGIRYHYIENGTFEGRSNRAEAEKIVSSVIEHLDRNPTLSLGIATFNQPQQMLIEDLIDKRLKDRPDLAEIRDQWEAKGERIFVKNLENVQGDERDVMFVSCTYGPSRETREVYQRFGPLNSQTGGRRLNVIITRARQKLEIFASLKSTDIKPGSNASTGLLIFRQFLKYVEEGRLVEDQMSPGGPDANALPDSPFEEAVIKAVRQSGHICDPQVGVGGFRIDIGVRHPAAEGVYMLGIECDGATYHSAKSTRDRDRLRQSILESKGWKLHRIWSADWFKNRDREIERLKLALKESANC
jgi:very-short-patch-repair endonuclease